MTMPRQPDGPEAVPEARPPGGATIISGRVVVVTGAASGIGAALAKEAARRGAKAVVAADVDGPGAASVADAVRDMGTEVSVSAGDLTANGAAEALAAEVADRHGVPGLVCANAGVAGPFAPAIEDDPSVLEWVFAVNVFAMAATIRAFGPAMTDAERPGWFLVTGSEHAVSVPHIGLSSYTASKHAVLGYADVLRRELPAHLGVTVVCPSMVATRMWAAGKGRPERFGGPLPASEVVRSIMSRAATPERTAALALDGVDRGSFLVLTDPASVKPVARRAELLESACRNMPAADGARR
jgi:NAD(P)-dependent dehydrogenase (short-subunit alcohol dehydrogenase family)